jgi:hypothetical protein
MSSRKMLVALVSVAALSAASVVLAGAPAQKAAKKRLFVGVVEKVDVKRQMIAVRVPETPQQVQTQSVAPKTRGGVRGFRVDAGTVVRVNVAAMNKTQSQAEQGRSRLVQVQVGSLVRVVYTDAAEAAKTTSKRRTAAVQSNPAVQQQTPVQQSPSQESQQIETVETQKVESPKMDLKAHGAKTSKNDGKVDRAISIEILCVGKPQGETTDDSQQNAAAEAAVPECTPTIPVPPAPPASSGPVPTPAPAPIPDSVPAPSPIVSEPTPAPAIPPAPSTSSVESN